MVVVQMLFLAIVAGAALVAVVTLARAERSRSRSTAAIHRHPPVFLHDLARILSLMARRPGQRPVRLASDPPGDFTAWFEGGALRQGDDEIAFTFADGSLATGNRTGLLHATIRLPEGNEISVREQRFGAGSGRSYLELAESLEIVGALWRARMKPEAGDPEGDFTLWFDGGTMLADLGGRTFDLATGARIRMTEAPRLDMTVTLPDGQQFVVAEQEEGR